MASFFLPDPLDAEDTIADSFGVVSIDPNRRDQVMKNSVIPLALLIQAGQMAIDSGPDEEAVFVHFLRSLLGQAAGLYVEKCKDSRPYKCPGCDMKFGGGRDEAVTHMKGCAELQEMIATGRAEVAQQYQRWQLGQALFHSTDLFVSRRS